MDHLKILIYQRIMNNIFQLPIRKIRIVGSKELICGNGVKICQSGSSLRGRLRVLFPFIVGGVSIKLAFPFPFQLNPRSLSVAI